MGTLTWLGLTHQCGGGTLMQSGQLVIKSVSCMDWQWAESLLMLMQVGGFSVDHHLGSGWLCKQFRAVA